MKSKSRYMLLPALLLAGLIFSVVASGCGDASNPPPPEEKELRVVSLSPAVSQVIVDLGMADKVVGRIMQDPALPQSVPVVSSGDIKLQPLENANPSHILVQGSRFPPGLVDFARRNEILLVRYPDAQSVEDIYKMIETRYYGEGPDGGGSIGQLLKCEGRARALYVTVSRKLRAIEGVIAAAGKPTPRVLLSYGGMGPLEACGPRTVHDQLLRDFLRSTNVLEDATTGAVTVSTEMLINLDPDVIILMRPGEPAMTSFDTDARLQPLRGVPIKAVTNRRVAIVNHDLVLLPSSSIWIVAAELGKAIHPDLADEIDRAVARIDADEQDDAPGPAQSGTGGSDQGNE